jgi:lysophospholipase L1-like esterase
MYPSSRLSIKGVAAAATLVLASVAITLIAAEFALRLAMPSGYYIWKPHMSRTFVPAPGVMPGVFGDSRFRTNKLGLRADELSDKDGYRILTIGGSTTECLYLDQTETWPQLLQDSLRALTKAPRAWVGNAGMGGRNSRHYVLAMRHLPLQEMKIDAVVLLAGINDLSFRLSQGDAFDPFALRRPEVKRRLMAETFLGMTRGDPRDPWLKRTVLWQLLRGLKSRWVNSSVARKVQDVAAANYDEWRRNRRETSHIIPELPDLNSALDEYERNLKEVAALARARSVRLLLLTQPSMWRPGLPRELDSQLWFGGVGDFQARPGQPYYSVEALAKGIRRYNEVLLQTCASEHLECIDLASLANDTSIFYDDVHFNEAGARQVAGIVANHFKARPPFAAR